MALPWLLRLKELYDGFANAFVLYNNVYDDIAIGGNFKRIGEVLTSDGPVKDAEITAFFNLGTGIRFPDTTMENLFIKNIVAPRAIGDPRREFLTERKNLEVALEWLGDLMRYSGEGGKDKNNKKNGETKRAPRSVVIFEYPETIIPPDSRSSARSLDRRAVTTFLCWAQDSEINRRGNLLIFLARLLENLAPDMGDLTSRIIQIEVPLPGKEEQEIWKSKIIPQKDEIDREQFFRLTNGLPNVTVNQLITDARIKNVPITTNMIFARKKEMIESQSMGLHKTSYVPYGFESLGDLDYLVKILSGIAKGLRDGHPGKVPRGMLFLGPPGVGKTGMSEAFSHEAGVPFVKFKQNVRNMFVGETERQLDLMLSTLMANAPLVWFIDEIDKFFQNQDHVYQGDANVSSNIQGMMLDFLSDPKIKGRVFVISATNRPWKLDPAMIRDGRFGEKVPFLIPSKKGRPAIIKALLKKQQIIYKNYFNIDLKYNVGEEELKQLADMSDFYISEKDGLLSGPPPDGTPDFDIMNLTGANLEVIIERSVELCLEEGAKKLEGRHIIEMMKRSLPSHDVQEYQRMEDEALLWADRADFIPPEKVEYWRKLRAKRGVGTAKGGSLFPN